MPLKELASIQQSPSLRSKSEMRISWFFRASAISLQQRETWNLKGREFWNLRKMVYPFLAYALECSFSSRKVMKAKDEAFLSSKAGMCVFHAI